ncbi:YoaK family protein [uncultured Friedmanniella sp.]|uniref:YoaK family protein n=1 Tax=uncultured Friedmanniella sp. TaxID=335381 RepID=UPI0035CBA80E
MSDRVESGYAAGLLILTAATGALDAVSYLALDRVFTGNMTGNVLFVAFGLVGVEGIPVVNNLVALLTFALGAALGSRLTRSASGPVRLPLRALLIVLVDTVAVLVLALVWLALGEISRPTMIVLTGLLALLLGAQAAAVRHIGLRDLSTVVVTMTLVNLAADSRLAGGAAVAWSRRIGALLTMGLGALASAVVVHHLGGPYALLLAGVVMAVAAAVLGRARGRDAQLALGRAADTVSSPASTPADRS